MNRNRPAKFVLLHAVMPTIVISFIINFLISRALFGHLVNVNAWGAGSLGMELVITSFMLPFITSLILIPLMRRAYKQGKVDGVERFASIGSALPANMFAASVVIGIVSTAVAGSCAAVALGLSDADVYRPANAIAIRTGFATLMAFAVSWMVTCMALAQAEEMSAEAEEAEVT